MLNSKFPQVVLASRNKKKSREIADLMLPVGIDLISVVEFDDVPEVIEDGDSFAANAAKKATQTAQHLSRWVIGEDSGLRVDSLKGAPGIYSARYAGDNATDEMNNEKLIAELVEVPPSKRGAGYVCHVALSDPEGRIRLTAERTCRGRIGQEPKGDNGFGYDPYFIVNEYHKTFGELNPIIKRHLSHRARAFGDFIPALKKLFIAEFGSQ